MFFLHLFYLQPDNLKENETAHWYEGKSTNLTCSAIVQYDPKFGKPDENRETITNVLTQVRGRFDVLLLPEMAFSGYMFENKEEVDPFCEKCGEGPTFNWCSKIAKEYNSIVVVGYPEKDNSKYYNSAYVVGVNGELVENVRKHFLYDTDYKWAEEGAGFHSTQVSISKDQSNLRLGFGICMDLNPKANWDEYEFANYHNQSKSQLILFCANWLDPSNRGEEKFKPNEHLSTQNYWVQRLKPLIGSNAYFAVSNRVGIEKGTRFAGCSCLIHLGKQPSLLKTLDRQEAGIIIGEIEIE